MHDRVTQRAHGAGDVIDIYQGRPLASHQILNVASPARRACYVEVSRRWGVDREKFSRTKIQLSGGREANGIVSGAGNSGVTYPDKRLLWRLFAAASEMYRNLRRPDYGMG